MKTKLRKRIQFKSSKPSMTQQHLKAECDVNSILEKYRKTGMITHVKNSQGSYGDFSKLQSFQENLNTVRQAHDAFDALPAHIRKRFANDPAQLVEFVMDNANHEEAQKLGLVPKAEKPNVSKNDDKTTKNEPKAPSAPAPAPQA